MSDDEHRRQVEEAGGQIGGGIAAAIAKSGLKGRVGFALMLFELRDGGWMAYLSDARREDVLRVMDEFREKVEGDHGDGVR